MPRYFTLREAEQLLTEVAERMRRAIQVKTEMEAVSQEFEALTQRVAMAGGMIVNQQRFLALRSRRETLAKRLRELIEEIHGYGCRIKDLNRGLLDFPTIYRGEEVLLCWELGEETIGYWHRMNDGFSGRRKIDEEFIENHQGESGAEGEN